MRRIVSLALAAAALSSSATTLAAQSRPASANGAAPLSPRPMPTGRYEFTSTDDDGDQTSGAVAWTGQRMRIDLDRSRTRSRRGKGTTVSSSHHSGDYMVVDFTTNTVHSVKPDEREINEMPLATFEQIIGKALGMVGSVVQMQVRDAGILAKEVGPGGEIAGMPTQQFRLVEEYNVRIGVFGMNAEEKHHRVVTDYWVPTQAGMPRNPMFELLLRGASATAQQDATHQANVSKARQQLFRSFPMKAMVTVTADGETPKRATVEITSLSTATPDASIFVLPSGYRVKKNDLNFSL